MSCKNCGKEISQESEFCPECGSLVNKKKENKWMGIIQKFLGLDRRILAGIGIGFVVVLIVFALSMNSGPKITEGLVIEDGILNEYPGDDKTIVLPEGVSRISQNVFYHADLTSIEFPESLVVIDHRSFTGNQLNEVTIPSSVALIGSQAFHDNQISEIDLPEGLTMISDSAFRDNVLKVVSIPGTVEWIGDYAFAQNQINKLEIFPNTFYIGAHAFEGNQLTEVVISSSVEFIGEAAFADNPELTRIKIYQSEDSILGSPWGAEDAIIEWSN